jgi:hypothetical protein
MEIKRYTETKECSVHDRCYNYCSNLIGSGDDCIVCEAWRGSHTFDVFLVVTKAQVSGRLSSAAAYATRVSQSRRPLISNQDVPTGCCVLSLTCKFRCNSIPRHYVYRANPAHNAVSYISIYRCSPRPDHMLLLFAPALVVIFAFI